MTRDQRGGFLQTKTVGIPSASAVALADSIAAENARSFSGGFLRNRNRQPSGMPRVAVFETRGNEHEVLVRRNLSGR